MDFDTELFLKDRYQEVMDYPSVHDVFLMLYGKGQALVDFLAAHLTFDDTYLSNDLPDEELLYAKVQFPWGLMVHPGVAFQQEINFNTILI